MSAGLQLDQYLTEVRQRLHAVIAARAGAVLAITALILTVLAVIILRDPGFPPGAMVIARIVLAVSLAVAAAAMLWRPLSALRPARRARTLERQLPRQNGRIETYLEQARRREAGEDAPFIELLAEDALAVAEEEPVNKAVSPRSLLVPAGVGAVGFAVLAALLVFGKGEWGFGSRNLWLGTDIPREQLALRKILVTPGNATVRRNQDVPIRAAISGFKPDTAEVFVRFGDAKTWERAPMKAGAEGRFEFTLYALREPLSYYVASRGTKSAEHRISVIDAPRIERMRLTYNYPSWTGLKPETDEVNRDINAVAGTRVSVEFTTTAPLQAPTLAINDDKSNLEAEGAWTRGIIEVKKAGHYRISARVGDEVVPLTDDYTISIVEDQQPTIEFAKPGRDWQASSIEEVPVQVHARDDFRVASVELHYSVNGGEWRVAPLKSGRKDVTDDTILRLEEMGELQGKAGEVASAPAGDAAGRLTPGDLVTYYAVAKDRKQQVQTDLFLIHVQPFERRFTQGQAGGMPGSGSEEQQNAISQRQREILLATWNLKRLREKPDNRERERLDENARMLSDAQNTLAEQARTLIERAAARGVDSADPKNRQLIDNLEQAAQAMAPAAKDLGDVKLAEAIPSEQKALQHLLRAEALYSDIEVQMRNSTAGNGNAGNAGRDLAEMFELEMDLDKNQYETQSRARSEQSSQQLEDALKKLRELAQRQERLAREAARQQQLREPDRWKQEQLKRETEDLRRRLEQLAQQSSQQSSQAQSSRGQGQSQGQGQGQSSSSSSAQQALDQVKQALQNMQGGESERDSRESASDGQSSGSKQASNARSAQLASRDLKEALEKLQQGRREGTAGTFSDLANRARQALEEQRKSESELLNALSQPGSRSGGSRYGGPRELNSERAEALAEQKRSLQSQLDSLQQDMQASALQHKDDAPDASKRVGSAANDLAESNLTVGLARSALELERGLGLQAATRERLITAGLENLQNDLDEAARIAATEARDSGEGEKEEASPEELLAELSELRRAWQFAQADAARRGPGPNDLRDSNGGRDPNGLREPNSPRDFSRREQNGRGNSNAQGDPSGQNPGGSQGGDQAGDSSSSQGGQSGDPNGSWNPNGSASNGGNSGWGAPNGGGYARHWIEGERGRLNGWSPPVASRALNPWPESPEFRRQAEETGRRLREMLDRMPQNSLQPADISALRQLANRLRRAGKDPMESEYQNMVRLVDQLELAALSAAEKTREPAVTRTDRPSIDAPAYREAVAEYYRRLGGVDKPQSNK